MANRGERGICLAIEKANFNKGEGIFYNIRQPGECVHFFIGENLLSFADGFALSIPIVHIFLEVDTLESVMQKTVAAATFLFRYIHKVTKAN